MTARAFLISTPVADTQVLRRENAKHIPIDSIVVLQASDKYTDAIDRDGASFILDDGKENTIKALALEYGDLFVEVKRGCLVRRTEIRSLSGMKATEFVVGLQCGMRVVVSRRNIASIRKLVREYKQSIEDRMSAAHEPIY